MADFKCGAVFMLLVVLSIICYFISYKLMDEDGIPSSVISFLLAIFCTLLAMVLFITKTGIGG